jgi:hypothetical protein
MSEINTNETPSGALTEAKMDSVSDLLIDSGIDFSDDSNSRSARDDDPEEIIFPDSDSVPFGANKPNDSESDTDDNSEDGDSDPLTTEQRAEGQAAGQTHSSQQTQPEQPQITREHLVAQAQELVNASNEIENLYQTNQISAEQYQFAQQNAQVLATQIKESELNLKEQAIQTFQNDTVLERQMNKNIAEILPEWNEPNNRQAMFDQLTNYLKDDLNFSQSEINGIQDPMVFARLAVQMKDKNHRHTKQIEQIKKTRIRKAEKAKSRKAAQKAKSRAVPTNGLTSRSDQITTIAELLMG